MTYVLINTVTEEQARNKWCPHTRNINAELRPPASNQPPVGFYRSDHPGHQPPYNRIVQLGSGQSMSVGLCIADQCMMWQWADPKVELTDDKLVMSAGAVVNRAAADAFRRQAVAEANASRRGYCGVVSALPPQAVNVGAPSGETKQ